MSSIVDTRESKVISILRSSKRIEDSIKKNYKKKYAKVSRHPSVREEQMPIFVSFLYDLIIDMKNLPSNEEFIKEYMDIYYEDVSQQQLVFFAYVYRVNQAYESLVRDLHFYFKLVESKQFDHVLLSYAYDIEAKQDLVVSKGQSKLGLQLFVGNDNHIALKRKQTERRRVDPGYPDYYLPLFGSKTYPVNICDKENPFYAYSSQDVVLIANHMKSQSPTIEKLDEEKYILPAAIQTKQMKRKISKKTSQLTSTTAKHSFVYVGAKRIEDYIGMIEEMRQNGVRIEWISPNNHEEISSLRVHVWDKAKNYEFVVVDGECGKPNNSVLKSIGNATSFNYEQYLSEHAPIDKHLIVEAGAGSGKTETIISRIIYLLHLNRIDNLQEVVMITFTNEAADNMKSKLSKRLFALFQITNNTRYITWMEQVTSMLILTIPSFSRKLIQDFSSELGMSRNFAVRSLTVERRELIANILDQYISNKKLSYQDLGQVKEYQLVKLIDNFWTQLEQKGIVLDNYEDIRWGTSPSADMEKVYYNLFKHVLKESEQQFTEEKLKQDVFTVNDLTQKLATIKPFLNAEQMSNPFKFLFVDEFQDTDDVQIEIVKTLAEITEAQLFVVGDIKQSIYRFRGANYTAFDLLSRQLGEEKINREYKLKKNYRTTFKILDPLEDMFDVWRNDKQQILPYAEGKEDNRLIPTIKQQKYKQPYKVTTKIFDVTAEIQQLYTTLKQDEEDKKDNKPVELAILVRTNYQAKDIRKILDVLRNSDSSLIYDVVTGGSLYSSDAARDLLILLNALTYEEDPESFYALRQTPFSSKSFNPAEWIDNDGDKKKLVAGMNLSEVKGFVGAKARLRMKPTLHVIYHFLTENPYESVLKVQNVQAHDIQKYRLNIYRMLELASNAVESSKLNIHTLRDWLELQIITNRDEDEMEVDFTGCEKLIRVMTIHKAKGLEFDTVFIPYTDKPLIKKSTENMIVARQNEKIDAGWKLKVGYHDLKSANYGDLKKAEDEESIREEARLLYVALTRAQHRLVVKCVEPKYQKNMLFNWSELIRFGKEGKR
ncbi:UvrD-helicase domain-containing protein [Alkalihalobacillus sp. LMS39]|uniref:UvrD-helicase domain-containing protein n=1 Tax=Alkalihalobacillus sp. LMS39 TaxID=2924032 RepID=UPI001FB275ED|nr:UvrD-helicase domain-containing protein [Alkalihalobacillus sp. LMS39]UOE95098.1 UvrD-helicase domain-containing protein [Alkalihalobacillus sp. LMS39]